MVKNIKWGGRIIVAFIAVMSGFLSSCCTPVDKALENLDAVMERKDVYRQNFLEKTDSLRALYEKAGESSEKWQYADALFKEYIHYSLDSAYVCLSLMKEHVMTPQEVARTLMAEVNILYQKHMDDLAVMVFNEIDRGLAYSDELRNEYLTCAMYLFRNVDQDRMEMYRDAYLAEDTVSVFGQKIHAQYLRDHGELQRALDILLACDGTEDNYHDKTSTVYNIAMLYDMLGDKENKKLYLARSGVYDFLAPNRDYMSIYQLALELYEEGDLKRANRYIETNLMDVIGGGFDHRVINSSKAHKVITEATLDAERERTNLVFAALVVMAFLIVAIGSILYYSRKQNRRLKETRRLLTDANSQVKKQNLKLQEANMIKDNYVFKYMDLSVSYIKKMEELKAHIRGELKKRPVDSVVKDLRDPSDIYQEYKKYYQIFDETFLSIFPDFRERVNELLQEDSRFPVPDDKSMATEFRILAVMRLGISESGKIATFLNCAPATIYTYRTKMRNAALCEKSEFEDKIRHL